MAEYIEREHLKDQLSRYLNAPHVRGGYSIGLGMRVAIKSCIAMLFTCKHCGKTEGVLVEGHSPSARLLAADKMRERGWKVVEGGLICKNCQLFINDVVAPTGGKWDENKSCATCMHRKDVLVPCDWLSRQKHVVLDCPHYERRL